MGQAVKTDKEPTHVYVARRPCGCIAGVAVDMGDKGTGAYVAEFIADGYGVDRVDFDTYRATTVNEPGFLKRICPHEAARLAAEPEQAALL